MGYQERDPQQRKRFLRLRERFIRRGQRPVHLDECGFVSSTTRRDGYALKGQRVEGLVSGHRRPHTSLLAARIEGRLEEPLLFEGTCDTVVFNTWLQTRLCPRLNAQHLVILNNATFHKSPETAQRIAATGATLLFLPPYAPDFNPIEHDFATLKKHWNTMKPPPSMKLSEPINNYRLSYKPTKSAGFTNSGGATTRCTLSLAILVCLKCLRHPSQAATSCVLPLVEMNFYCGKPLYS